MPTSSSPCVLVVADPGRIAELAAALSEPLPQGSIDVLVSSGGDDTIDLFESRSPRVVVLTAGLEIGDSKSLIETLREMVPRTELAIVLIGDDDGPIRTALDAIDMKPDRFVSRPLSVKGLRFAVSSGLEAVARALGETGTELSAEELAEEDRSTMPIVSRSASHHTVSATGPVISRSPTAPLRGTPAEGTSTDPGPVVSRKGTAPLPGSRAPTNSESGPVVSRAPTAPLHGTESGPVVSRKGTGPLSGQSGPIMARPPAPPRSSESGPVRVTNDPAVARVQTPVRGSGPVEVLREDPAVSRSPTPLRGSGEPDPDAIAITRRPTPIRGSGDEAPGLSRHLQRDDDLPAMSRSRTRGASIPNVSESGPTVSRTPTPIRGSLIDPNDRTAAESGEPNVGRSKTDRGTGIPALDTVEEPPVTARAPTDRGTGIAITARRPDLSLEEEHEEANNKRAALRARWEALADSIGGDELIEDDDDIRESDSFDEAAPLPPPIEIGPRRKGSTNPEFMPLPPVAPWRPGTTSDLIEEPELSPPQREPTLILHDPPPSTPPPLPAQEVAVSERSAGERWSQPVMLSELIDRSRDSSRELLAHHGDDLAGLDELDDDMIGHPESTPPPHVLRGGHLQALEDLVEPELPPDPPPRPEDRSGGRDFARQLRAKMSMMAQRLFQTDSPAQPAVDMGPRHDHHTEIDLAALGEEPALGGGVTEIESRGRAVSEPRELTSTSPGSWDTQVRERGLPDSGEIVRGVSDAAMVLAKMFAQSFTGRVGFRKDEVEKVVYFDQGRPVFASSNEAGDRMGELLVREGKITASQYERCQLHVAQSGRRMGEILVDFGYLKRRELLPAVRRHVEDIIYSLFGWDRGHYRLTVDTIASAERIRLSRHPASLVMEGIRRKLDRTALEKSLGPASTVIEVPDRERLGGIINTGDLAQEERAALAAFDGQADLGQVARTAGVDIADVLPLAWGLCVLGLATARRAETDAVEESAALVGETDLAIDRERVHARWQLVTEADYFALLGVRRDATTFEIRRAYQAARRDFAADCFPNDLRRELARELEDIADVLDEAFRVLRDDRLRVTYLSNLIE